MKKIFLLWFVLLLVTQMNAQDKSIVDFMAKEFKDKSELASLIPHNDIKFFHGRGLEAGATKFYSPKGAVSVAAYKKKTEDFYTIGMIDVDVEKLEGSNVKAVLPYGLKTGMTAKEVYKILKKEEGLEEIDPEFFLIADKSPFKGTKGIKMILSYGQSEKEKKHQAKYEAKIAKYEAKSAEAYRDIPPPKMKSYKGDNKGLLKSITFVHPDLRGALNAL
ncbi:MAG: hypothetical protein GY810_26880 [Aureispira sp.]|nr:hypothetical protein [Aureispira sp.]